MRKETPYSPGKQIHAKQKFKEALDSKLNTISEKQKPCASLLFSGIDFNKSKNKDANCRQNSPHINEEIQYKSKQLFSSKPYSNSRKQSETIKSEESHQQSTVQAQYQNLFECTNYQKKGKIQSTLDIFQMMKDINNQKIGISAKINYKKKCDARYEQQSNLRQCKYNLF
ncbi:unnamed protein product [Paramecium sonneborni]|uniref:Uncharacterized protein n=1 Tax=Paramecium sonneborni TaxID=65129 RepID=A0A8S1QW34_9CILI|nr:unnamed protein product [Paramecium sonneborni]